MKEVWSIQRKVKTTNFYNIVSNRSSWTIATDLLYNHAMTIITHFNKYGACKLTQKGDVENG